MTNLDRAITGWEWERHILPSLPRPLTPEQAAIDLSYLARARALAGARAAPGLYGYDRLAERWGWEGEAGVARVRRLMRSTDRWVDAGLKRLRFFVEWMALRETAAQQSSWTLARLRELREDR